MIVRDQLPDAIMACCTAAPAYAVTDGESARECIAEKSRSLRRIARHYIDRPAACRITLPEDDPAFQSTFITACQAAGIQGKPLTRPLHAASTFG